MEKYFEAYEQMERMSQFSTADHRELPSKSELKELRQQPQQLGTWTPLGPGNIGGRTRAIIINSNNPDIIYAGGVGGGVWKTTNGGESWTPVGDKMANIAIGSLAFDPRNPDIIYAGTGEAFSFSPNYNTNSESVKLRGAGIFKSVDAGQTWTRLPATANNPAFFYVSDLAISATDSNRIYAATGTGVQRSTDGGMTWSGILSVTVASGCVDLALRTDQPNDQLFASCGNLAQATVYRAKEAVSATGNTSWETLLSEPGMGRTAIAPSSQDTVYALAMSLTAPYYTLRCMPSFVLPAAAIRDPGRRAFATPTPIG
ncbi:MAG: WD40/YVTN/BNR-like repeat-containing protein [Blastocatellia bacterium]